MLGVLILIPHNFCLYIYEIDYFVPILHKLNFLSPPNWRVEIPIILEINQCNIAELVELLASILEFDYKYVLSEDNKFGSPEPNGTWNGLIKMLLDGVNFFLTFAVIFNEHNKWLNRDELCDLFRNLLI